jgi:hypothetical protein
MVIKGLAMIFGAMTADFLGQRTRQIHAHEKFFRSSGTVLWTAT